MDDPISLISDSKGKEGHFGIENDQNEDVYGRPQFLDIRLLRQGGSL